MEQHLLKLQKLDSGSIHNATTQSIVIDYLICLIDGVAISSWAEDVAEEPEAYPYTEDQLEQFLFTIN